jgi:hypothetical protein
MGLPGVRNAQKCVFISAAMGEGLMPANSFLLHQIASPSTINSPSNIPHSLVLRKCE